MKAELVLGRVCCEFNCVLVSFKGMLETLIWFFLFRWIVV